MIIGSFLNVVIFRLYTDKGLNGRSKCLSCDKQLYWYELIPVLSFIFLRGKCSGCKSGISWQYPLVELLTGIFFAFSVSISLSYTHLILNWFIASLLVLIFVYDLKHKIIPDRFSVLFALGGILYSLLFGLYGFLYFFLAGLILPLPFFLIWYLSKGRLMGLGDVKLMVGIGFTLGFLGGFSAILSAFFIGAVFGLLLILITRLWHSSNRITMKSEIPFGPFLIFGFCLVFYFNFNVFQIISNFIPSGF